MARRFFIVEFLTSIQQVYTDLNERLDRERPAAIVKILRCYHALLASIGRTSLWAHAPDCFQAAKKSLAEDQNSILHFFQNSDLDFGADKAMPWSVFTKLYRDHCVSNRLPQLKLVKLTLLRPLNTFHITLTAAESRIYRGGDVRSKYLVGVDAPANMTVDI